MKVFINLLLGVCVLIVLQSCCTKETKPKVDFEGLDMVYPLECPAYIKHFKIKEYKEVLEDSAKKLIHIGGGDERRTLFNFNSAVIWSRKGFDTHGNLNVDYHFGSEGPIIYKYEYTYDSLSRIKTKADKSYLYDVFVEKYFYNQLTQKIDSIVLFTESHYDTNDVYIKKDGKRVFNYLKNNTVKETFFYDNKKVEVKTTITNKDYELVSTSSENNRAEVVTFWYLNDKIVKRETDYSVFEYSYHKGLLITETEFNRQNTKEQLRSNYIYDNKGLLIKKKSGKRTYNYVYEFYN